MGSGVEARRWIESSESRARVPVVDVDLRSGCHPNPAKIRGPLARDRFPAGR